MLLFGISLAPIIFIVSFIYLKDKYQREPLIHLVISFLLGAVMIIPAIFGELFFDKLGLIKGGEWWVTLFECMIGIALIEELVKYIVLRFYIYPRKDFDEPFDGIVYAVTISMGFAAIENIMYVFGNGGIQTGILRMFTAVPGHAMFGVLMGYFVGLSKFSGHRGKSFFLRMFGLVAAIIPHGLYDFFLFRTNKVAWFVIMAILVLIIGIYLSFKAMRIHQNNSPFMSKEPEVS